MKSQDKLLIGIVVGLVLLIVVAILAVVARPEETYLPDDSPENIVHNYLLALQMDDNPRAYGYLSPRLPDYPLSLAEFEFDLASNTYEFRDVRDATFSVRRADPQTDDHATVPVVRSRYYGGDIFESGQSISSFSFELELIDGKWKIVSGDDYFLLCWTGQTYSKRC